MVDNGISNLLSEIRAVARTFTSLRKNSPLLLTVEVGLSLGFCLILSILRPAVLIDDAGFILRYLDHFKEGCFYCFNPSDGPVFGLSGFVHGMVAALLALLGLSARGAVLLSNYIGIFGASWVLLRVLRHLDHRPPVWIGAWLALLVANKAYFYIANTGMETPIHLMIVLGAILAFLKQKERLMWILLALSAISKLDAVPIIMVVAAFHFFRNRKGFFEWSSGHLPALLFFGILPIGIWILFASAVFGSPLPQSGYAKAVLLFHRADHWFPFFQNYTNSSFKTAFFFLFLFSWLLHLFLTIFRNGGDQIRRTVFGFAFLGVLTLYYFYNPGERMLWYYALPNLLMLLQTLISLLDLSGLLPTKIRIYPWALFLLGFIAINVWKLNGGVKEFNAYLFAVEKERLEIGHYIAEQATGSDTLMASHGLTSRPFPGYVIDMTGLNSKLATDYQLDREKLIQEHAPHWIVEHDWTQDGEIILENGYELDTTFYNIIAFGHPGWRVYKRASRSDYQAKRIPLEWIQVTGGEKKQENQVISASGDQIEISLPPGSGTRELRLAIPAGDIPIEILCTYSPNPDSTVTRPLHMFERPRRPSRPNYFCEGKVRWETGSTAGDYHIKLTSREGKPIRIYSPWIISSH